MFRNDSSAHPRSLRLVCGWVALALVSGALLSGCSEEGLETVTGIKSIDPQDLPYEPSEADLEAAERVFEQAGEAKRQSRPVRTEIVRNPPAALRAAYASRASFQEALSLTDTIVEEDLRNWLRALVEISVSVADGNIGIVKAAIEGNYGEYDRIYRTQMRLSKEFDGLFDEPFGRRLEKSEAFSNLLSELGFAP